MRTLARLSVIALFVTGCAGAGSTAAPSASPSPTATAMPTPTASPTPAPTSTPRYPVATEPGKLVLKIASEGGFINPAFQLTRLPTFALYSDGRALLPSANATTATLVPDVRQMQLSPADLQKVLALADADGLLQNATYNSPANPDSAGTVITTVVGGKIYIVSATGLSGPGVGGHGGAGGGTGDGATGMPQAELLDFESKMSDLPTFLGRTIADAAYIPTAARILTSSAGDPGSSQPSPPAARWPVAADPGAGSKTVVDGVLCTPVSGADLNAFMSAGTVATPDTVWTASSGRYTVEFRPLYPDEHGC